MSIYAFNGIEPLRHSARRRSSLRRFSGIKSSEIGSLITKRPFGFKTRYISCNAFFKSSILKILNKQFCAATSTELSSIGKFKASPLRRLTKSDLNQGFRSSASLKFSALASSISCTMSTPITPFF